jgi:hypothetical protein
MITEFINCTGCGKRLIERKPNGSLYFRFGKPVGEPESPVEILIFGSVKIKCLRKRCGVWNVINGFPKGD